MRMTLRLITLGCPKNTVDSEKLAEKLRLSGITVLEEEAPDTEPDIFVVNTCGFIEDAKKQSINEILRVSKLRRNGAKLVVIGCLAERYRKELKAEMPEIDALFGVGEEDAIAEYIMRCAGRLSGNSRQDAAPLAVNPLTYAYIKIAEGCNRGCSYCIIPTIRGRFRSLLPDNVLKDAQKHIKAGKKELILVAQDLMGYGKDINYSLKDLIKDIASIDGDFWIRLLYLNPASIDEKFIEFVSAQKKLLKYLDIPFQHSEDSILRAMNRSGNRKKFLALIKQIKEAMPDVALRTTLIVGFPGETEEDFARLKGFVEEAEFDRLGVFSYSKEEGTPAAKLKGQLPKGIKNKRLREIMTLQAGISLKKNQALIGRTLRCIVDEPKIARIYSQAPEIDGVTLIKGGNADTGRFTNIRITAATEYDLFAEVVK